MVQNIENEATPFVSHEAELFIGVVARIGVDTADVVRLTSELLREYAYRAIGVRVTDALKELGGVNGLVESPLDKRIESYVCGCNALRRNTKLKDVMARFAIAKISLERSVPGPVPQGVRGVAYIINQLKRPEESDLLRSIYGEHYVQISFHATEESRSETLSRLIARDNPDRPKPGHWKSDANRLIRIDEMEEDEPDGQRLRSVFPTSDIVIDCSSSADIRQQLDRFFRALFGDKTVTPTKQEYGMHLANAAALRSSDLSRQVGAAILNQFGEVQAIGCNEVPRAGGGTYWEGDADDDREFRRGRDSNDERKLQVLLDLALRLRDAGIIRRDDYDNDRLRRDLLNRTDDIIRGSQLMDSLEYGRTIHAEMNAITDAARGGHAIRDANLYCNTFPCHNCAKHIVASGISNVVYLHPYPKSYADELFGDSISVDGRRGGDGRKVRFDQFTGIMGQMYTRVFSKKKWKNDDGNVPRFDKEKAKLVLNNPLPLQAYVGKEMKVIDSLGAALEAGGYR